MATPLTPAITNQAFGKTADCAVGAVSVSLDTTLAIPSRGLIVGVSGAVACVLGNGQSITFPNLAAGIIHPISVSRVNTSGTTATGIIATY